MLLLVCQQSYDLTPKLSVGAGHRDPHGDLTSFHRARWDQPHRRACEEQMPKIEP